MVRVREELADHLAAENAQRLEQIARRRIAVEQRLSRPGEETAYLLRIPTGAAPGPRAGRAAS